MYKKIASGVAIAAMALSATAALANHSWGGYHWARTSNPFTIKLADNVSPNWDQYLVTTSSDWSQSVVLDTTVVQGFNRPKTCKPTSGQVEVCNASYGNNGWLGIASIWASGLHITQGTVKLNDTYFNTAKYNTPAWRNLVLCQEVGHTFGLDHQDENFDNPNLGTCMDYTSDPSTNQHPNQHDYDMLESIYAHLDGFTTIAASRASIVQQQQDLEKQEDWGKEVKKSGDGKTSLFEKDLGNGNKVFTFVVWAE